MATATIEVEFEAKSRPQAEAALRRMAGDLSISIQHGKHGSGATGVVSGTVKVTIKDKRVDGEPVK